MSDCGIYAKLTSFDFACLKIMYPISGHDKNNYCISQFLSKLISFMMLRKKVYFMVYT